MGTPLGPEWTLPRSLQWVGSGDEMDIEPILIVPRRHCLGDSAQEHPVPRNGVLLGRVRSWEYSP